MATNLYANRLREILNGGFQGTPGFAFARDQGLQAAQRSGAARGMGGSGNVLAELAKLGTGYAAQDYGNEVDRLGRLSGQDQQFQLGQEQNANTLSLGNAQNANTASRNANDFTLGQQGNATNYLRTLFDYDLGGQNAANARRTGDQQFGLGMYRAGNDYSLGQGQNAVSFMNARTNRNTSNSSDWLNRQRNARDWWSTLGA